MAIDRKAVDTVIIELSGLTAMTDYFVICSGENPAQIRAIADSIDDCFSGEKIRPMGKEGMDTARWVLLDYGDIVVHIFDEETRAFYDLEKFWIDAPRIAEEELSAYAVNK